MNLVGAEGDSLVERLAKYYELEFRDMGDPEERSLSLNDRKVLDVTEKSIKRVDGRYVVGLPWRDNASLPNNYA